MSDSIVFDRTVQMIEDRLNLNSMNQKLISSNLANINTPGYSAKELSFESTLRQSLRIRCFTWFARIPNTWLRMNRLRQCGPRR